jgi:hypothetical protein
VFSLLAATTVAHPGSDGRKETVIQARGAKYAPKEPPLTTPWTDKVGTDPWPEYPRPQMQRSQWQNLNGVWQYRNASSLSAVQNPPFGQDLGQEVLVPSCLESGLSGRLKWGMSDSWSVLIFLSQGSKGTLPCTRGSPHRSRFLRSGRIRMCCSTLELSIMKPQSL